MMMMKGRLRERHAVKANEPCIYLIDCGDAARAAGAKFKVGRNVFRHMP